MTSEYDYDLAFSFAGEDRRPAESLAKRLKQQNVSVFYDRDEQAQAWGENLQEYLTEIYLKKARFCVMFISQDYAEKMWTRHERRTAMARALQQKKAYILPIRLDRTELEGLLPSVAYINLSDHSEDEIVGMILEKLDTGSVSSLSTVAAPSYSIPMPRIKKTFSQREKDVFARKAFDVISRYFEQGLKQLKELDTDVDIDFESVHRSKFLARVYVKGEPANACKIWLGGGWGGRGGDDHISYHEGQSVSRDEDNSVSDMFSIATDGHLLGLEANSGMAFRGSGNGERLLPAEQAAELLWQRFTKRLSVD